MARVNYEEVSIKATRRWRDENGKPRQETKKFSQTINPWNVGAAGRMKTREQITKEITRERDLWLARAP